MKIKESLRFYIGFVIFIKTGSTLYFQNCSTNQLDKYISCDGNRKSDCYYKVLYETPTAWQLDGWIECSDCLENNYSLVLQNNHNFNLHFTTRSKGKDFWQGVLVKITFPQANEIKSLRRWFILMNTISDLNSIDYNCITARDNPNQYQVDFIKIYNQDMRYSVWNSGWFSLITAESVNNDIRVCFNIPPRVYNFTGFDIYLVYSQTYTKNKEINNSSLLQFGDEICVLFEDMSTGKYTAKINVKNSDCECNPTKVPYLPDLNIVKNLCNCPISESMQLNHIYDPKFTTGIKAKTDLVTATSTITDFNMSLMSVLKDQNVIIAISISSVIACFMIVAIGFIVFRSCYREQQIFNIHYYGHNPINNQLAGHLIEINKASNKDQRKDSKKIFENYKVHLLIHENECDLSTSRSTISSIERPCSCFEKLEKERENIGIKKKLIRRILYKKICRENSIYVFPDHALEICKLICNHDSAAEKAVKELIININSFIGKEENLTSLRGLNIRDKNNSYIEGMGDIISEGLNLKRDSGYDTNPKSTKINNDQNIDASVAYETQKDIDRQNNNYMKEDQIYIIDDNYNNIDKNNGYFENDTKKKKVPTATLR